MVDHNLLVTLKEKFEAGSSEAKPDDLPLVLELLKQLAVENDEVKEELSGADFKAVVEETETGIKYWFTNKDGAVDYGEGEIDDPSFKFIGPLSVLAAIIFQEKDGPSAYMAGEISIEGNIADGLAFNEVIAVSLDAFEDLIEDL
ncbi:MAG: SCP2 sterol-binding domain-containing protein [Promethearchaeota archaeon]